LLVKYYWINTHL